MSCLCIKKYGFDLDVSWKGRGCDSIIIEDMSTWIGEGNKPDTIKVKMYIPSQEYSKVFEIKTDTKNIISSKEVMGSEGVCLPDDIYCFTLLDHCGFDEMVIQKAYLCSITCKVKELIASSDTDEEYISASSIYNNIKRVEIALEKGLIEESTKFLDNLRDKIKSLTCESC